MFQILPVDVDNIMAVKASGKLTDEDYQQFLPKLNEFINTSESAVSLLIELEDFHGWDKKAAWDDFKFAMQSEDDIARIAIVGEHRWQKWMTVLGDAFTVTDMRYFSKDQLSQAWSWLRSSEPEQDATTDAGFVLVPYRHILLATDFSEHSAVALKRAEELAKIYQARLSLIHAVEPAAYPVDTDFMLAPTYEYIEAEHILFDNAQERLQQLAEKSSIENVQHEVVWGSPKYAVLSYAEAQNVDLIVVGSHGRHGLARLLGSTASSLLGSASSDVVVVRIPQ